MRIRSGQTMLKKCFFACVVLILANCSIPPADDRGLPDDPGLDADETGFNQTSFDGCWAWFDDRIDTRKPQYHLLIESGAVTALTPVGRQARSFVDARPDCRIDAVDGLWGIFLQRPRSAQSPQTQVSFRFDMDGPQIRPADPDVLRGVMIERVIDDDQPQPARRRRGRLARRSCQ